MSFDLNLDNISYIKIAYKDRNEFMHCTKAMINNVGEHEIYASSKYNENIKIPAPQNIVISFITDNGIYKANTKLKHIKYKNNYVYYIVATPEELEYMQNREYFRVRMREKAIITYLENEDTQRFVVCETYDISANGLRVILNKNMDFPTNTTITIFLNSKEITIKARYIRNDTEDNIIKASFKYEEISKQDMDYISQQCIKKQLEDRRRKNGI